MIFFVSDKWINCYRTILNWYFTFPSIIKFDMIDLFLTNLDRFLIVTGLLLARTFNFNGLLLDCLYALYLDDECTLFGYSLIAGPRHVVTCIYCTGTSQSFNDIIDHLVKDHINKKYNFDTSVIINFKRFVPWTRTLRSININKFHF